METKEEVKVIRKAKKGNRKAFEVLMEEYGQNVYAYVYSLVFDKQQVDDLYQDIWFKVFRNLTKYDELKPFSAWLMTVARNTIYDYGRKAKVIQLPIHEHENTLKAQGTPESECLLNEEMAEFVALLDELSEKDRTLIVLKYVNDLSNEEIAIEMGMEVKEVKWNLYEAKKRLRRNSVRKEVLV